MTVSLTHFSFDLSKTIVNVLMFNASFGIAMREMIISSILSESWPQFWFQMEVLLMFVHSSLFVIKTNKLNNFYNKIIFNDTKQNKIAITTADGCLHFKTKSTLKTIELGVQC